MRNIIAGLKAHMKDDLEEAEIITSRKIAHLGEISQSSAYTILVELEGKWKKIHKEAYLNESTKKRRVAMAQKLLEMKPVWGDNFHRHILFTDER